MIASLLKYAPVQVFSALSVFALIAVQTRFLSPENYGVLAVAMVVLELVRAFSAQWLNTSMLRLHP
ncbi:oligosaccharide flippase family protein, partial [Vibrio cholerae]|uniref:oligosaccharide flippase family protein n=1 Tax=Vibrio cholerae TaxID=666 RepID=UPI0018F0FF3D